MRELNNLQIGFLLLIIVGLTAFSIESNHTGMIYRSSSVCGNNVCENDESIGNCAADCLGGCGDGVCEGDEEYLCPDDCAYAPKVVYFKLSTIMLSLFSLLAILLIVFWLRPVKTKRRRKKR